MTPRRTVGKRELLLAGLALLLPTVQATSQVNRQPQTRPTVRLEAVAETKLLMEGLTQPNFRGLEKLLKQKPSSTEEWTFARGQALLLAETGNLLLLRPPAQGRDLWFQRAVALREAGTALARLNASKDHERARQGLISVANACNACHKSFRIPVQITPFADKDVSTRSEQ